MPKSEVIAANLKIADAKAKFTKSVETLKEATTKKIAAAEEKGKKAAAKVVETVAKVDAILTQISEAANDTKVKAEKRLEKISKLAEKAAACCDKHLV